MPRLLRPVDLGALPVQAALIQLAAALDGTGDALLPTAPDPVAVRAAMLLHAGTPLTEHEDDEDDPTALVVATSGSTGRPRGAVLPSSALLASAEATHERLGGPGHWLLALPTQHIAGTQVLVRSVVADTTPAVLDLGGGFQVAAFTRAADELAEHASGRRYTALVPTQLVRLLAVGGAALAALTSFDAVLVGGADTPQALRHKAEQAGVRIVTTYGMSETCGGCVYDEVPLPGVRVVVGERIQIGGPMVARGYRLMPDDRQFTQADGTRWFQTNDTGSLDDDGRLHVLGRADDVIVTGGEKVVPQAVEAVLAELVGVRECLVVGVPDREWGQRVVALVVAQPVPELESVRDTVIGRLGGAAGPRAVLPVERLPQKALGKPDRLAAAQWATQALTVT